MNLRPTQQPERHHDMIDTIKKLAAKTSWVDCGDDIQIVAQTHTTDWTFGMTYRSQDQDLAERICNRIDERGQIDIRYWVPGAPWLQHD